MGSHHAAASGIQAPNICDEQDEPPLTSLASCGDAILQSTRSQKRQKITHLHTSPLLAVNRTSDTVLAASHLNHAEPNGTGEFDYLLHWKNADHDVLEDDDMLAGEDDEEEEGSDGLEEDDADGGHQEDVEMQLPPPGKSRLTEEQIVEIINESIDQYASAWTPNRDALEGDEINYDPEEMWLTAERDGMRDDLIQSYEADVAYYTQRLDRLCDEILKASDSNAKDVKKRCRHLEVTVNAIELAEWLASIYRLDPSDDEEEDDESRSLSGSKEGPPVPQTPHHQMTDVVDLGSPSDSSDEGTIVDSSPQPHTSSDHSFHTPDSVIGGSIAADAVVPTFAIPGSANSESVVGDSVIVDTTEPRIPQAHQQTALRQMREVRHGDSPHDASIMSARRWKWEDLRGAQDRKRIITKVIQEMRVDDRETIRHRLATVGKADLIREIPVCVEMLAKNQTKMHGVLARDLPKIVTFTRLFLCWWLCDNYFRVEPSKWDLNELQMCLQEQSPSPDPDVFYDYLDTIMRTTFSPEALMRPDQPSQAEVIEISDDEEPSTQPSQPRRKKQIQPPRPSQSYTHIVLD